MDEDGNCWLLQMTLNDCVFSRAPGRDKTEIVFVYTGSNSLQLDDLNP